MDETTSKDIVLASSAPAVVARDGGLTLEEAVAARPELAERYGERLTRAAETAARSVSSNTAAAYRPCVARYVAYCEADGLRPWPADPRLVAAFLSDLNRGLIFRESGGNPFKGSTIALHLPAINHENLMRGGGAGLATDPEIAKLMAGIRRDRTEAKEKPRQARALMLDDLRAMCSSLPFADLDRHVAARRDHFALLATWGAGLRRSELCLRTHGDISPAAGAGLLLDIPYSKTDQDGRDRVTLTLRYRPDGRLCAPCAYARWSELVGIHIEHSFVGGDVTRPVGATKRERDALRREERKGMDGWLDDQPTAWGEEWEHVCSGKLLRLPCDLPILLPVSRLGAIITKGDDRCAIRPLSGDAFNEMVQRRARAAGIEHDEGDRRSLPVSAHGLRAGFITQSLEGGATYDQVAEVSRHKTHEMLRRYDRRAVKGATAQDAAWGA